MSRHNEDDALVEEEEEELDDEEEEEEEEEDERRRRKRKKTGAAMFVDDEAEVDEDDEDEEEGVGDDLGNMIAGDEEVLEEGGGSARHSYRELLERPATNRVEEVARRYEERAADGELYDELEDDYDDVQGDDVHITQQSLLPSVRDPKLWMLGCKVGKEREIALIILQKFVDKENTDERLLIKSVVCPDHLKGHVYIEADKESHVRDAVKGVRDLFFRIKLVPIKEMTDVLTVTRKPVHLEKNSWVRVKRGVYRGDIAQVYQYEESKSRATVKLVPRLDFSQNKEEEGPVGPDGKRKRKIRPAQRFVSDDDIIKLQGHEVLEKKRDASGELLTHYLGERFRDGFIFKTLNLKSLEVHDIVPTLDELQKFQHKHMNEDEEGDDMSSRLPITVAPIKGKRKTVFAKGDTVRVVEGDLRHLMGVVESVDDGEMVTIMPKHEDLHDLLSFPASQLQKHFKEGDHCKVVAGQFEGETGLIVRVDDNIVTLLSDLSVKEIRVLASDIQECTEVTSGRLELGGYELHDMVQVNGSSVGVIIKIERDSFRVLDTAGRVQSVGLQEIGNKRNNKNAAAFDTHRNPLVQDDMVAILEGPHKGKHGRVKHVFRYTAFLYCKEVIENGGIIVAKCNHLNLLGGKKKNQGVALAPRVSSTPLRSPRHQSPAEVSTPRGGTLARGQRADRNRTDPLYHQTIIITKGSWKGYLGIVKEITDTTARVELHTNCKTINVAKGFLQLASGDRPSGGDSAPPSHFAPATPSASSSAFPRTPSREEMPGTPMRTPRSIPDTPSRDPFNPAIPNTPRVTSSEHRGYSSSSSGGWDDEWAPGTPRVSHTPGTPSSNYSSYAPYYTPSTPLSHTTPQTPGTAYVPAPKTPDIPVGTPATPAPHTPHTPLTPLTPVTPVPLTPGVQVPQTPTPHTPYTDSASTPSSSYEDTSMPTPAIAAPAEDALAWQSVGIYAQISPSYASSQAGFIGVISEVDGDTCKLRVGDNPVPIIVASSSLLLVSPAKKDRLRVISGQYRGESGTLAGVFGNDGIVKMDQTGDIHILPMGSLVKIPS